MSDMRFNPAMIDAPFRAHRRRRWQFSTLLAVSLVCPPAAADFIARHRLTVAAHPSLGITIDTVDTLIRGMNQLITGSEWGNPWDSPCPEVEFVRHGAIVQDNRLDTVGTYEDLAASLKAFAPAANVLIASYVTCDGLPASGCSAIGKEPLVVVKSSELDPVLWIHERGHGVGLNDSARPPADDTQVPPAIGMRIMFWMVEEGHTGKIPSECARFASSKLPSVTRIAAPPDPLGGRSASAASGVGRVRSTEEVRSSIETKARARELTVPAYRLVVPPWAHGIPVDRARQLNPADIASIRSLLSGSVTEYWQRAIIVLATVGSADDVELIKKALELPMPTATSTEDSRAAAAFRNALGAKMAAPLALGLLANRTQSSSAVDLLIKLSEMEHAAGLAGPGSAAFVSRQALEGLSIANTPIARAFLTPLLESPENARRAKVAPLQQKDLERLRSNSSAVTTFGIDGYLKPPERER